MVKKLANSKISLFNNRRTLYKISDIKLITGADLVFNGGLFNGDYSPCCDLKIKGEVLGNDQYTYWGYGFNDKQGKAEVVNSADIDSVDNYISCLFAIKDGKKLPLDDNQAGIGGSRGRTAFGYTADGDMIFICTKDGKENYKLSEVQQILLNNGCVDGIILDGGGSSQASADFGSVYSSRIVPNAVYVSYDSVTDGVGLNAQVTPEKEPEKEPAPLPQKEPEENTSAPIKGRIDTARTKGKPNLFKQLAVKNKCYLSGKPLNVKGLMLHSTGANNTYLKRYVQPDDGQLGTNPYGNSFNEYQPNGSVCVHGFIGKLQSGEIASYQILPWNMIGWHCGSGKNGSANNTHIGVEICEDGLNDSVYFYKVYAEAVELFAYLCEEFGLTEDDIICHSEGCQKGIASNHGDVMHWFPKYGKSMDTFREDVGKILNAGKEDEKEEPKEEPKHLYRVQVGAFETRALAEALAKDLTSKGYKTFIV